MPWVHGRDRFGPEEVMKYVCEASQGQSRFDYVMFRTLTKEEEEEFGCHRP